MKVVILAGGLPSVIIEQDEKVPKPMAEIGGHPILWHIMKQYSSFGYQDFIICAGYKIEMIKDYFMNYYIYQSDITIDLQNNDITLHEKRTEDWNVTVINTGLRSSIPERIKMIQRYLADEPFIVSYGDCVSDINIDELVQFHKEHGKIATYSVARPIGRSEILPIDTDGQFMQNTVINTTDSAWVNACNMVFEPEIFGYLKEAHMEKDMFHILLQQEQILPYKHRGFWSPMETIRDKTLLEEMWNGNQAVWKIWKD